MELGKKVTVPDVARMKAAGERITMVTAYDCAFARLLDQVGGDRVQGRRHGHGAGERERVLDDARAVQEAGAFAVVLECIPLDLAAEITAELKIPTIGIGAGAHCDGQVLVLHDLLGLSTDW